MPQTSPSRERVTLDLKLGHLLEARATGWAVLLIPGLMALVIFAVAVGVRLR